MQTACPHCNTIFRLTEAQLSMADGVVRCGMCHQTFNALQQHGARAKPAAPSDAQNALLDAEPLRAVVPEAFRRSRSSSGLWAGLGWSLLIILLALALVGEYAFFHRNQLQQQAELKPWLEKACGYLRCELEALREPDKIIMLSRNIYSHPTVNQALMVAVTMVNQAGHEQPWPDVLIEFSNIRGGIISARRFTPDEYLAQDQASTALLANDSEVSFNLEIVDPGKDAMTYEFSFL